MNQETGKDTVVILKIDEPLLRANPRIMWDINQLLPELNPQSPPASLLALKYALEDPGFIFFGAFQTIGTVFRSGGARNPVLGYLMGLAELHVYRTVTVRKGIIENVIVGRASGGQGIGQRLMQAIINEAKTRHLECLDPTSNPARIAANRLYLKCGFTKRNTNCFHLALKPR